MSTFRSWLRVEEKTPKPNNNVFFLGFSKAICWFFGVCFVLFCVCSNFDKIFDQGTESSKKALGMSCAPSHKVPFQLPPASCTPGFKKTAVRWLPNCASLSQLISVRWGAAGALRTEVFFFLEGAGCN